MSGTLAMRRERPTALPPMAWHDTEVVAMRELTRAMVRLTGAAKLDIDFALHHPGGPAMRWLAGLGPIGAGAYLWAAGEASALAPIRRHLVAERGLSPQQLELVGYWLKGGVADPE